MAHHSKLNKLEERQKQPLHGGSRLQAPTDHQRKAMTAPGVAQLSSMAEKAQSFVQRKANRTGMPDALKQGVENLSGLAMDDVRVHYNSSKPAQLQAHAYAQGSQIHLGRGQEKHLPHEAWHVVQQKQGRVQPTTQLKGVGINDNAGLEREADVMGERAKHSTMQRNMASVLSSQKLQPIQTTIQRTKLSTREIMSKMGLSATEESLFQNKIMEKKSSGLSDSSALKYNSRLTEYESNYASADMTFHAAQLELFELDYIPEEVKKEEGLFSSLKNKIQEACKDLRLLIRGYDIMPTLKIKKEIKEYLDALDIGIKMLLAINYRLAKYLALETGNDFDFISIDGAKVEIKESKKDDIKAKIFSNNLKRMISEVQRVTSKQKEIYFESQQSTLDLTRFHHMIDLQIIELQKAIQLLHEHEVKQLGAWAEQEAFQSKIAFIGSLSEFAHALVSAIALATTALSPFASEKMVTKIEGADGEYRGNLTSTESTDHGINSVVEQAGSVINSSFSTVDGIMDHSLPTQSQREKVKLIYENQKSRLNSVIIFLRDTKNFTPLHASVVTRSERGNVQSETNAKTNNQDNGEMLMTQQSTDHSSLQTLKDRSNMVKELIKEPLPHYTSSTISSRNKDVRNKES